MMVRLPATIDTVCPNHTTNVTMPNKPYTMEGMPLKISMEERMTRTSLLPFLVYSLRYTAVAMPSGTAIIKLRNTTMSVVTMLDAMV